MKRNRVVVNLPEDVTTAIEAQCPGGRRKGQTKQAWVEDAIRRKLAGQAGGGGRCTMVPNASWHRDLDTALEYGDGPTQAAIKAALRCFRGQVRVSGENQGPSSEERPQKKMA